MKSTAASGIAAWRSGTAVCALAGWKKLADTGVISAVIDTLLEIHDQPRPPEQPVDLAKVKSAAVIRLDEIGDVVLTSPLLRQLRRNLPHADITLIVKDTIRPLVELCPYVNRVLGIPIGSGGGGWSELRRIRLAWRESKANLWRLKLDLALIPRFDLDQTASRLLAKMSGARWRVGFADPRDIAKSKTSAPLTSERFLTQIVTGVPVIHEVLRPLEILAAVGGSVGEDDNHLEVWTDADDELQAAKLLGPSQSPKVAMGIAALQAKKRWPVERFAEVARQLHEKYSADIVLIGGPQDHELAERMIADLNFPVIDLIGKATLRQTAAVLRRCRMYVGNDTGPLHLAAAVGIPIVAVIGHPIGGDPSWRYSPERFGPWKVPHRIARPAACTPPCTDHCQVEFAHCIEGVTVGGVIEAAESFWKII